MKDMRNTVQPLSRVTPNWSAAALGCCLALSLSLPALAGKAVKEIAPPAPEPEDDSCFIDPLWNLATFVDNKDAAVLQYLGLNGRYQGQYHWLDSNEGNEDDWENRRSRIGFEGTIFNDFEFSTSFNVNLDGGEFFDSVDEAHVKWKPAKQFNLTLGKSKPAITPEYRNSSRYIITIERSQLVNQLTPDKLWGAAASGAIEGFLYDIGVYSGALDGEDYDLPASDGGFATWLSLGYKSDAGTVRGEWFYNDGDEGNNGVADFDNVFSVSYEGKYMDDKLSFLANALYGEGQAGDRGDVWGIVLMPSYYITDSLEVVFRYTYSDGDSDDAISMQSRYERRAPELVSSRAGQYQAGYAGLNYYVCGQRLKLMAGVEYAQAEREENDFEGWTAFTGVRMYFGKGKK